MRSVHYVVLLLATSLTAGAGCRRGQVFAGKPAVGNGVRVDADGKARAKGSSFNVALVAHNDTDEKVEINRNQIALVTPDGKEVYRQGSKEVQWLDPRGSRDIALEFNIDPASFKSTKGAYCVSTASTSATCGWMCRPWRWVSPAVVLGAPTPASPPPRAAA